MSFDFKDLSIIHMKLTHLFSFLILLICLTGCTSNTPAFKAEQGKLDLRDWDLHGKETVYLNGEWELYWNQLLNYEDILMMEPELLIEVPSTWSTQKLNNHPLPNQGYATYRLQVRTSIPEHTILGLRIYPFASAYSLFVNDKQVAHNGVVATNAKEEVGEYKPETIFFSIPAETFDIIIQVSNFHYNDGGFMYHMALGSDEAILIYHEKHVLQEAFLHGSLFIMMILFLTIYLLRRELRYALYFSFLCFSMIFMLDSVGQYHFNRFFPSLGLHTYLLLWYSSLNWLIFFLILYVHRLYPSRFSMWATRIYLITASGLQLLIFLRAPHTITHVLDIGKIIAVIGVISTFYIVAVGIRKGKKDGWLNMASMLIILITYVHDNLYWANVITHSIGELVYISIFLFLVIQMILQARRIQQFHIEKTEAELSFLQAQIKPHFLYNSLNTIIYICSYDMKKARKLLMDFSLYLRRSFDFKNVKQYVPLKKEVELARAYISIEKSRFDERLEVTFDYREELLDMQVPALVLQPVLENAVVHGILPKPAGGSIIVSIRKEKEMLTFTVEDNGVGIQDGTIPLEDERTYGKGIGLSNIHARLIKINGKGIEITSIPDTKTIVTWKLPLNKKKE